MAIGYGAGSLARKALGNPSPQAEGRRTDFSGLKPAKKATKGVPLEEWPDHVRLMNAMTERLKKAKEDLDSKEDADDYAAAQRAFDDAYRLRESVGAQLQEKRDQAQAAWEANVEKMSQDPTTYSRRYQEASQSYAAMKDGSLEFDEAQWLDLNTEPKIKSSRDETETTLSQSHYMLDDPYIFNPTETLQSLQMNGDETNLQGETYQGYGGELFNQVTGQDYGVDASEEAVRPVMEGEKEKDLDNLGQGGTTGIKYKFDINGDPID